MGHNADDFEPLKSELNKPVVEVSPAPTLESLTAQVNQLTGMVGYLIEGLNSLYPKAGQRVMWEDKVTKAGITLEGSAATPSVQGILLGANFIPTGPTTGTVLLVVRPEGQQAVTVIDSTKVKFIDG